MDAGQMVEFDHPHMLLKKADGCLRGMVDQTGRSMAEILAKVALQVSLNSTCSEIKKLLRDTKTLLKYRLFYVSIINYIK